MTRRLGCLVLALALAQTAFAQGALEDKYKEKLAKDFATKVTWLTDIEAAMVAAKKQGKLIFGYFTRSYAP